MFFFSDFVLNGGPFQRGMNRTHEYPKNGLSSKSCRKLPKSIIVFLGLSHLVKSCRNIDPASRDPISVVPTTRETTLYYPEHSFQFQISKNPSISILNQGLSTVVGQRGSAPWSSCWAAGSKHVPWECGGIGPIVVLPCFDPRASCFVGLLACWLVGLLVC